MAMLWKYPCIGRIEEKWDEPPVCALLTCLFVCFRFSPVLWFAESETVSVADSTRSLSWNATDARRPSASVCRTLSDQPTVRQHRWLSGRVSPLRAFRTKPNHICVSDMCGRTAGDILLFKKFTPHSNILDVWWISQFTYKSARTQTPMYRQFAHLPRLFPPVAVKPD